MWKSLEKYLGKVNEQMKKDKEDKVVAKEEKRYMVTRLEERSYNVQNITNTQLQIMNQIMPTNQELNKKDMEIENLRSQNNLLRKNMWKNCINLMK